MHVSLFLSNNFRKIKDEIILLPFFKYELYWCVHFSLTYTFCLFFTVWFIFWFFIALLCVDVFLRAWKVVLCFHFVVNNVFIFCIVVVIVFLITFNNMFNRAFLDLWDPDSIYWRPSIKDEIISADIIPFTALCFFECSPLTCFFSTFEGSLPTSHPLASAALHVL